MKKVIMLSGVPGTGKSYYARENLKGENVYTISSDEIRKSITHSYAKMIKDMNVVYDEMIRQANELIEKNNDVTIILDSTFLTDKRRNYFLNRLNGYDFIKLVMLKVHDENLIFIRNKKRIKEKWVPEDVIRNMIASYAYPSEENVSKYNEIEEVYTD